MDLTLWFIGGSMSKTETKDLGKKKEYYQKHSST